MPELPEVETIRRGLAPLVLNRRITQVVVRDRRLRWPVDRKLPQQLAGQRITSTERRGKYLLLLLDSGDRLMIHLGMSGRLLSLPQGQLANKHDHLDLELSDGRLVRFHDPRRFGAILLWPAGQPGHVLLDNLGPEPLSSAFNGEYLHAQSRGRTTAIKNFIMDGSVVVGAGNIYAAEALFRAGIRPARAAGKVTRAQYARLADAIRVVLAEAIEQGGTTLRDFANAEGRPGYFQQKLFVYGREGEACLRCGAPIQCRVIGQRSSFYCPVCQK